MNKIKKFLVFLTAVVLLISGLLLLPQSPAGASYPQEDIYPVINSGAAVFGGVVDEQRSMSGDLRGVGVYGRAGDRVRKLLDLDAPADVSIYSVRVGPDRLTVTSFARNGDVFELRIEPSPDDSKQSEILRNEILTRLPGLKFKR